MTRNAKIVVAAIAAVVAINVLLVVVHAATGGTPGGPVSSSYSTGDDGAAAYASLLAKAGHDVSRLRKTPSKTTLSPESTVVLLDPPFVLEQDARSLESFLDAGGRLVVAPGPNRWLDMLLAHPPTDEVDGSDSVGKLAPTPEVSSVSNVVTDGASAWDDAGNALPVLGAAGATFAAIANIGSGRLVLMADASPLQNAYLGDADDAAFAVAAAGPSRRPVVFLESYHGYGEGGGAVPLPHGVAPAAILALIATVVFGLSRIRRLGPPEPDARELAPPRAEYVEALGTTIARTRDSRLALGIVQDEVRRRIARRAGLGPNAGDAEIAAAAERQGLSPGEIATLSGAVGAGRELELGRALAATGEGGKRAWTN